MKKLFYFLALSIFFNIFPENATLNIAEKVEEKDVSFDIDELIDTLKKIFLKRIKNDTSLEEIKIICKQIISELLNLKNTQPNFYEKYEKTFKYVIGLCKKIIEPSEENQSKEI